MNHWILCAAVDNLCCWRHKSDYLALERFYYFICQAGVQSYQEGRFRDDCGGWSKIWLERHWPGWDLFCENSAATSQGTDTCFTNCKCPLRLYKVFTFSLNYYHSSILKIVMTRLYWIVEMRAVIVVNGGNCSQIFFNNMYETLYRRINRVAFRKSYLLPAKLSIPDRLQTTNLQRPLRKTWRIITNHYRTHYITPPIPMRILST